jgi:hypothetical protein
MMVARFESRCATITSGDIAANGRRFKQPRLLWFFAATEFAVGLFVTDFNFGFRSAVSAL